jgi:bifunctional non-homologous end joining protein LigD
MPRFVVQEHYARSHHFDLRLERDGVLVSWAVPKGVPIDPKRNRLAVHVEDHALSHLDYEDDTPVDGVPSTVKKSTWDSDDYESHEFGEDKVIVTFHGDKVVGKYAIFHTSGKDWMIHRMDPPPERS